MGTLDFSPNQQQTPVSGNNVNFSTIATIKTSLSGYNGPSQYLKSATQRLNSIDKNVFGQMDSASVEEYINNINQILSQGGDIDDAEARLIHDHIADLMRVYQAFLDDISRNTRNTQRAYNGVIPVEYLDETDIIFWTNIRDRVLATENMNADDIVPLIREITIDSPNITKEDWDSLFTDLKSDIPTNKRAEFDRFVTDFKANNELYKNGLNIESIDSYLDGILDQVEEAGENDAVNITIGGKNLMFETKKSALQFIYKMKLILSELDKMDFSFMAVMGTLYDVESYIWGKVGSIALSGWDKNFVIGVGSTIVGAAAGVAVVGGHVVTGIVLYGPIESLKRNVTDYAAINFGKTAPSTGLLLTDEKPTGRLRFLTGWRFRLYNFLKHAHDMHHDPLPEDTKVTVFDGFENANDRQEDIRTKQKALRFFEQMYANDPIRLEQLNALKETGFLGFTGGQQSSATRTFWLRLYAIHKGYNYLDRTGQVFNPDNKKVALIGFMNDTIRNSHLSLEELFQNLPKDAEGGTDLDKLEKTDFYKHMLAYVDLDGTLSNAEEKVRNDYIKELINKIKNLEIYIDTNELRQEFMIIADGKVPKYKTLEIISERTNTSSGGEKRRLNDFLQKVQSGDWIGTTTELDSALQDIRNNTFTYSSRIKVYSPAEFNTVLDAGKELHGKRYELPSRISDDIDFINEFKIYTDLAVMTDSDLVREDVHDELRKLYKDIKGGKDRVSLDYTAGHLHNIVHRILKREKYANVQAPFIDQAAFDDVNTEYESKSKIGKELRRAVFADITNELARITAIPANEAKRRIREFEKFNNLYTPVFEAEGELKILIQDEPTYDQVKTDFLKLRHEVSGILKGYVESESGNLIGKAKELLDTAEKIDPTKKDILKALRQRISAPDIDKIPLKQLEHVIREILVGNITKSEIGTLDFASYDDFDGISSEAQEIRIIESRSEQIYDADTGNNRTYEVAFTDESRFSQISQQWNDFMRGQHDIEALRDNLRDIESVKSSIKGVDERLIEIRTSIANAPNGSVLGVVSDINVLLLEEERGEIKEQKAVFEEKLTNLTQVQTTIRSAPRFKTMSVEELDGELLKQETAFRDALVRNPGFQDYASSRSDRNFASHSTEQLWKDFLSFAQLNTVKTGGTLGADDITRITEVTPRNTPDVRPINPVGPREAPEPRTGESLLYKGEGASLEIRGDALGRAFQGVLLLMEIHPEGANESVFDSIKTQSFNNKGELVTAINKVLTIDYDGIQMQPSLSSQSLLDIKRLSAVDMMARVIIISDFDNQGAIADFESRIWSADEIELHTIKGEIIGLLRRGDHINADEGVPYMKDIIGNINTLTNDQQAAIRDIQELRSNIGTKRPAMSGFIDLFKRAIGR